MFLWRICALHLECPYFTLKYPGPSAPHATPPFYMPLAPLRALFRAGRSPFCSPRRCIFTISLDNSSVCVFLSCCNFCLLELVVTSTRHPSQWLFLLLLPLPQRSVSRACIRPSGALVSSSACTALFWVLSVRSSAITLGMANMQPLVMVSCPYFTSLRNPLKF